MKYTIKISREHEEKENKLTVPVYEQTVEDLDVPAVIAVVNKLTKVEEKK